MPACCVQKIPPNAGRGLPEYLTVEASRCIQFVTDSITEPIHASKNIYIWITLAHMYVQRFLQQFWVPSQPKSEQSQGTQVLSLHLACFFECWIPYTSLKVYSLLVLPPAKSLFLSTAKFSGVFMSLNGLFLPSSCQDQTLTPMSLFFTWKIFRFQSQK